MATRKNPITDPDGSKEAARITAERDKRVREKLKNQSTVGSRAAELAAQAGMSLTANIPKVASQAVNAATVGVSNVKQAINDVAQLGGAPALRFALAVPLTGLPRFIQLPDFDSYNYEDVMSTNTQISTNSTQFKSGIINPTGNDLQAQITCPKCQSSEVRRNGKTSGANPKQKLVCKQCNHRFTIS